MKKQKGLDRRSFIKASALGLAGVTAGLSARPSFADQGSEAEFPKIKEYRTLGRTGFKVSDIGIGTARVYPIPVMNAVLDAGVNYIDTADGYGRGTAEKNIGEAIKGRDRKSLFITTKIRMRGVNSKQQVVEKVQQCLQRLQADYVDCLMVQGPPTVESLKDENFHQGMDHLKKEGKVKFVGVANHGSHFQNQGATMEEVLVGAVEDGRYDVLLLVYNFLQKEAGERILEAAAKKNVATTIMKSDPLGRYFQMKERVEQMKKEGETVDERMQRYMTRMEETAKQADSFIQKNNLKNPSEIKAAALKFVLANPKVNTLNLAFNNFDEIQNNLKLSGSGLGKAEKNMLAAFEEECSQLYCRHACGLCESSCPHHVPVNTIMRYNHYFDAHGSEKFAMEKYAKLATHNADYCRNCAGWCEQSCPYGVPIQGLLNIAHAQLTF
ncbi:MAG: aldo/keto reductase [Candidatus Aminicenantes bacterium]|nr:aldo/keto reductase [Candidatus Aminicenantes bacterium]